MRVERRERATSGGHLHACEMILLQVERRAGASCGARKRSKRGSPSAMDGMIGRTSRGVLGDPPRQATPPPQQSTRVPTVCPMADED
ncbi:hypothetical protein C8Q76DRAFT_749269 [Earliella scabrosa]|nr:hypothetical protein C8Q76DRAFT_749269 [Earliella scabrosa]